MACSNCYLPNRTIPDMDREKLNAFLSKLPFRTEIRLIGGEATLRSDLSGLVKTCCDYGHKPVLITNGLKLASSAYVDELFDAGLRDFCLSMNGGSNDDIYEVTDQMRCANQKIIALKNVLTKKARISIGCIVIKGINDQVPRELYDLVKNHRGHFWLNFRNIGRLGRHMEPPQGNYTFESLVEKLATDFGWSPADVWKQNTHSDLSSERSVAFPVDPTKTLRGVWVKITDWNPVGSYAIPDPGSRRRGRVTQDFKVAPFFEHLKDNEFNY